MMARNSDKKLIWDTILDTITTPDNSTPHARLFNLINQHFQHTRNLGYKQFIAYCMSALAGSIELKDLDKIKKE